MQEKNRESNQKNAQKEPNEQKNQKTTASKPAAILYASGPEFGPLSVSKSFFDMLNKLSELYKSSENLGFQWCRETGEAPPVADEASLFRGRLPNSGYFVSAVWLEPTVYPFLGYLRAKSRLAAVPKHACGRSPAHTLPFHCGRIYHFIGSQRPGKFPGRFSFDFLRSLNQFSSMGDSARDPVTRRLRSSAGSDARSCRWQSR